MPDLRLRICGVTFRVSFGDGALRRAARRRYAAFRGSGPADVHLDLEEGAGLYRLDSALRVAVSWELSRRGGFLCHAAAADGWLFPGPTGAGKSTLGRSVPSRRLLGDELVGVVGGWIYGTPFRGNFRVGRNGARRPLEAVFFLDRAAPRGVRAVPKAEALARLLRCVLFFGEDAASGGRILRAARACVERVPTFVLSYDAGETSFRSLERMIREALR